MITLHRKHEPFRRMKGTYQCSKEPDFSHVFVWSITSKLEKKLYELNHSNLQKKKCGFFLLSAVGSLSQSSCCFEAAWVVCIISTRH